MENFFTDSFEQSIDAQHRVALPRPWRSDDVRLIIFPGKGKSLEAYTPEKAKERLAGLMSSGFDNEKIKKIKAMLGAFACSCSCDKQNRITISSKLVNYADLKGSLVFVGAFDYIQIYSKENWEALSYDVDGAVNIIDELRGGISDDLSDLEGLFDN